MNLPLVSIVVPCFRQAKYLGGAIESVLAQTYAPIEIIVVNDGSDDDTDQVAGTYAGGIHYIKKVNGGVSSARNAGIGGSRGEFLLFLDADDLLHPDAIRLLVDAVGASRDTFAMMGCQRFTQSPEIDGELPRLPPRIERFFPWLLSECMPLHCHLCPREVVTSIGGFDQTLGWSEDYLFWLEAAFRDSKVKTVPAVGAYYRRTPGAATTQTERSITIGSTVILRVYQRFLESPTLLADYGSELLLALYGFRRKIRARKYDKKYADPLTAAIVSLHERGIRVRAPFTRKVFDRLPLLLQNWVEAAGLSAFRVLSPTKFNQIFE